MSTCVCVCIVDPSLPHLQAHPFGFAGRLRSTPPRAFKPRFLPRELSASWSSGMRRAKQEDDNDDGSVRFIFQVCMLIALPMALKSSVTLCAVLAEVSKKSRPASSAYSCAVFLYRVSTASSYPFYSCLLESRSPVATPSRICFRPGQ